MSDSCDKQISAKTLLKSFGHEMFSRKEEWGHTVASAIYWMISLDCQGYGDDIAIFGLGAVQLELRLFDFGGGEPVNFDFYHQIICTFNCINSIPVALLFHKQENPALQL